MGFSVRIKRELGWCSVFGKSKRGFDSTCCKSFHFRNEPLLQITNAIASPFAFRVPGLAAKLKLAGTLGEINTFNRISVAPVNRLPISGKCNFALVKDN